MSDNDPHGDQPLETAGVPLDAAEAAVVMVHGRGASATSFLRFAAEFDEPGVAYVAPQARNGTWYPDRFLAPIESNEPWLSSALAAVGDALDRVADAGVPTDRTLLLGFSQGACLASEFVARNPRRYGGLAALSGGLIGSPGTEFDHAGDLERAPVFLGCGDRDPHIPVERVRESSAVFERLNGDVTERIYEGMAHGINDDELDAVADMIAALRPADG